MLGLRRTIRLFLKSPGFTITAVLILGFGIGTNTAVFSLISTVLLDPNIIGQNLTLSGESFQVIGVCRRQAEDVTTVWGDQVYVPLHVSEVFGGDLKNRGLRGMMCLGRLKEGVTLAQAQADLKHLQAGDSIAEFLEGFPSVKREQVLAWFEESKAHALAHH
jgi:uncharacterized protein (DUF433 family)